ncbi:MAG: hypothetical protein ACE3JP_15215 [Ectobacillus sp.]
MPEPFDITDVTYVKRITIGNTNPESLHDEGAINEQLALLNRCLHEAPRGKIIGQEKGFHILRIGEHQVVMQYISYHIGFKRKPGWLTGN